MTNKKNKIGDLAESKLKCRFCDETTERSNLYNHLKIYHCDQTETDLKQVLKTAGITLNKAKRQWLKNKESIQKENELRDLKNRIRNKYKQINKAIDRILSWDYLDDKSKCDDLLIKLKEKSLTVDFGDTEVKMVNQTIRRIDQLRNKPTKGEYIKKYCKPIYFTWDNITFRKNSIDIIPLKGKKRSIEIAGSLAILNHIKVDYFKRLYDKEVYRIVYKKGKIEEEFSPDLAKIKDLIRHRYNNKQISINSKKGLTRQILKGKSRGQIISLIYNDLLMNKYLKYPADNLLEKDDVLALLELNNGIIEEALMFIFLRNKNVFVLWENINSKRAGYLFQLNSDNYKKEVSKIKTLIQAEIKNKRQSLFYHVPLEHFEITCNSYKCLIHENELDYTNKLKMQLNGDYP